MIDVREDEAGMLRVAPVRILLSRVRQTPGATAAARAAGQGFGDDGKQLLIGSGRLAQAAHVDYDGKSWDEVAVEIGLLEVNQYGFLQGVRA